MNVMLQRLIPTQNSMHDVPRYHRCKQMQLYCCCGRCCCLPITSLIVIELRFIALFIISRNHTASLVISIPIKVDIMENNKNIWNDKEDSLFGFTLEDVLTSRKKLKRLIESVESTCLFPSKSDDFEKVYNSPEKRVHMLIPQLPQCIYQRGHLLRRIENI